VDDTVGTEAGVTSAELLAANQPATDQPRTAATAPDIRTDDESCDSAAAGDSEWLSYACSSSLSAATDVVVDAEGNVSSEPSPTLHARAADTAVDCAAALCSSNSSAATGTAAGNVASSASDSAVITYGAAEFVSATNAASSCQTANALPAAAAAAAANDTTLRLSFGTILAESFVTGAQSAAAVVSTQASVGSMSAAGETSATSDLVRSSAPGVLLSSFFTACALNQ